MPITENSTDVDEIATAGLNLTKGKAGTIMDRIIQEKMKQNGRQRRSELLADGDRIMNELTGSRRLTSGVLVSQGEFTLGPNVLLQLQARDNEKKTKEHAKAKKERLELSKRKRAVATTLASAKGNNVRLWNARECKSFLQLKKNDTDPAMPSKVDVLREHCMVVMSENRPSPTVSPHASDDEEQQQIYEEQEGNEGFL